MRGPDWGVLIVLAFCVLAAWPFLLQLGLPRTNASEHYVYRTADTVASLAEGRLYPRWSPNVLGGYGAPIPNYYPPGAVYLPALIDALITNDAVLAVKLTYVAALCLAGSALYAFVARRAGAAAGVIAALLYVYSPYLSLVAPHLLGDLPGVISLALIPALLWGVDRLLHVNHPFDLLYVALTTAALALTDVPAALVGWLLAAALIGASRPEFRRWYLVLGAGVLGVGLAGCYWVPALAEMQAIQWYDHPDALAGVLTLGELLAPLRLIDPGALIPARQYTLGLALPLLTLASIPLAVRRRLGFHSLFLTLGLALTALALTAAPAATWLLGPITLCLAVGASAVVNWRRRTVLAPLLAGLILIAATPSWIADHWSAEPIDVTPLAQVEYEQFGYGIAGPPDGAAMPSTIPPDSQPNRALIASYRSGTVAKVEGTAGAQLGVLAHNTHSDQLQVQTVAPLTLHILTAFFPGWSATLNGAVVRLSRSADGLIDVAVPNAARGELAITLDSTPERSLGWALSWGALAALLVLTLLRARRGDVQPDKPLRLLPTSEARLLGLLLAGFTLLLVVIAIPGAPLRAQVTANYQLAGSATLDNRSDSGLELLAFRVGRRTYQRGESIDLTLYWHTLRFLTENYGVRLSLLDLTTGVYREPSELRVPGGYPTRRWLPGYYVTDRYSFALPEQFPPGNYSPALEVCPASVEGCTSPGNALTFFTGSGDAYGSVLVLPIILSVE